MKAYKVELIIIDFDEVGEELIRYYIENTKYPNHCISPQIKLIEGKDIGEWHDNHPLNSLDLHDTEYAKIFSKNDSCEEIDI